MTTKGQERLESHPVDAARSTTDSSLQSEREKTDRVIEEKLAEPVEQPDKMLQYVRDQADRQLARAKQEVSREAETPTAASAKLQSVLEQQQARLEAVAARPAGARRAGDEHAVAIEAIKQAKKVAAAAGEAEQSKAREAVEHLTERAEEALESERQRVDVLTGREREERKHAFLEVLSQERWDTDQSLGIERESSDFLVNTRDEILAVISHDLRNLINAISLKAEALSRTLPEDSTGPRKLAAGIQSSCKVMARWVGDLVDLSSIDAGILELHGQPHDPADIIERATQAFVPLAEHKGIRMEVEVPEHRPSVVCDLDRIVQVLTNLLDNAVKFTPPAGVISVRFELGDHGSIFCVSDTGPGIPESDRAKVFERRWHASKGSGGGTGLGLYISKRIIESHRGSIWVESQLGQGSRFCFSLPVQ